MRNAHTYAQTQTSNIAANNKQTAVLVRDCRGTAQHEMLRARRAERGQARCCNKGSCPLHSRDEALDRVRGDGDANAFAGGGLAVDHPCA